MSSVVGASRREGRSREPGLSALLFLATVAGGACSGPTDGMAPVFISDFEDRSPILACAPIPALDREAMVVEELVPLADGGILAVGGNPGTLLFLDERARITRRLRLPEEGPGGVGSPVSATLTEDAALLVADAGRMRVKALDRDGRELGTVRTGFSPLRVRSTGAHTFVVPGVVGGYPDRLLYRLEDGELVPEPLPLRRYPGMTHGSFANRMGAAVLPGDRLLLLHGFYVPEAYVWSTSGIRTVPVPVPDANRRLFQDPRPVETEADLPHMPVVGVSPLVLSRSGSVVYLTRSGGKLSEGVWEKALIRVDSLFRYQSSARLPVDALLAAPLPGDSVLVVSAEGRWHRCPAP